MTAESMVPVTPEVMQTMMYRVTEVLLEYGVLRPPPDDSLEEAEHFTDSAMKLFQDHGLMNQSGEVALGRCILLPSQNEGLSLLLVTPCPVDEYDDNLQRKPSPVRFDRTPEGAIVLPGRWFLTKIEELADNPTVSEDLRDTARRFSRTALVQSLILPSEIPTVALNVPAQDGSQTQLEALPGGTTLTVTVQREA
ncbi:MAG TPA: hypothetical protein VJQ25_12500 [Nitrospira sp.]|nr:hypothetical protein [Nitrospira sp.]